MRCSPHLPSAPFPWAPLQPHSIEVSWADWKYQFSGRSGLSKYTRCRECAWSGLQTFEVDNMSAHAKLAEQRCRLGGADPLDCPLNLPAHTSKVFRLSLRASS